MITTIQTLDGQEYRLTPEESGLKQISFDVDSPNLKHTTSEDIAGRNGALVLGTDIGPRSATAAFKIIAYDRYDYPMIRNNFFRLLCSGNPFYWIDDREPGKRWLFHCDGSFSVEQLMSKIGEFEIPLIAMSGLSESIVRTTDNEFRFDSKKLQWGMGIIAEPLVYKFNTTTFRVFNAGDIPIDWRNQGVTLSYKGASNQLRIRNLTTGADWQYLDSSTSNDTIRLIERARSRKNTLSIFGRTNMAAMTLAPGWNEFQITGSSGSFEVTFDFRFLYL